MTEAREARWPGRVAALILLVWYVATMARGLMWFDTGEFALVGAQFGLGHPPGQPLYTLILGGFARIPSLDPLLGMNLLSALCAAACALPADGLTRRLTGLAALPRCLVLVTVGALTPIWDQATRIELYAPATLLVLVTLAAGLRALEHDRLGPLPWLGLGALVGLTAGINPILAVGAALAVGTMAAPVLLLRGPVASLLAIGAAALGAVTTTITTYLYVWWVKDRADVLVWGPLETRADWIAYLTGRDYGHTEHSAWGKVPEHMLDWATWLVGQGALPVVLLGVAGWCIVPTVRRRLPLWALPFAIGAAFTFTYGTYFPQVPDYNGYLMSTLWLSAVGVAGLLAWVRPVGGIGVAAALLLATTVTGDRPVWERSRAGLDLPHTLAAAVLDAQPEGGLLLVDSDHLVFPLMYLQAVERRRPDVVVFNTGFGASSWYWDWTFRQHPELARIPLPAPSTAVRLRRLIDAAQRPVRSESIAWAFRLRLQPCPATWGFGLGPSCASAADAAADFHDLIRAGWASTTDPISRRVLAAVAHRRAEGLWALGDASGALAALRAGIPDAARLPVPPGLRRPADAPPLVTTTPVLIGHPDLNRALGARALTTLGRPEARAWLADGGSRE